MTNKWIRAGRSLPDAEKCMICIPFAGSGASLFAGWQRAIGDGVEILPIQLPGREDRIKEQPMTDINDVTDAIAESVLPRIGKRPFIIFGHSMGGLISYALTEKLESNYGISPEICVISASSISICRKKEKVSEMNDDELINELSSYGGMDKQLLAMPEYLQMYLNIIRNDYKLIESFAGAEQKTVKAKFRLYSGTDDSLIKENDMVEWESLTSSSTTKRVFEGGHFFIKQYYKDICNDIIENT